MLSMGLSFRQSCVASTEALQLHVHDILTKEAAATSPDYKRDGLTNAEGKT